MNVPQEGQIHSHVFPGCGFGDSSLGRSIARRVYEPEAICSAHVCAAGRAVYISSGMVASKRWIGQHSGRGDGPAGGVVPNAKVSVTNKDTGRTIDTTTTSAGTFSSGSLGPATYTVRVEAPSFKTTEVSVSVVINVVSNANVKLELGSSSTVVEVSGQAVAVNTEQAQVSGTLTTQQIENLPVNGRNFLDLAQLEPGVQIQDGTNFDPTKPGFSSISFGGRFGRTARIEADGVDVSDETVGTTTQNIPSSAIQEFQIA
jgi:hypothetical protein